MPATDLAGRPWDDWSTPEAKPPAPVAPPPPPQETWNDKVIKMRQAGASQDQVDQIETEVYTKLHAAGATDSQAAEIFGVKPTDIPTIANRYKVAAASSTIDDVGATLAKAGDAWLRDMNYQAAQGVAGIQAGFKAAGATEDPEGYGFLGPAARQALPVLSAASGAFTWLASPVTAAIDVLGGHRVADVVNTGLKGAGVPETVASMPRDAIGETAIQIAPFMHIPKVWPHALAEDYVRSGQAPEQFVAQQHQAITRAVGDTKPLTPDQQTALVQSLPHPNSFRDTAIQIAGEGAPVATVARVQAGLQRHWIDTGEGPAAGAQRAAQDPHFRQQLISGAFDMPAVPAGSARAGPVVMPKQPVTGDTWTAAHRQDLLLPKEANEAVHDWTVEGNAATLNAAFDPNPGPGGAVVRAQLRSAAAPIRDALRAQYGPTMTLYRVKGPTENITSFTNDLPTAIQAAGGGEVITEKVPVNDVAWATERGGQKEFLVHTGDKGKPWSLSERAPTSDTLTHKDAETLAPKPQVKPKPLEPATDPRTTLAAARASPADWIEQHLGEQGVRITGGARTPEHNAAVGGSSTSEHLSNAAWDFHVVGRDNEGVGIQLARNLREKGVPFDQIEITPTHVHIGFKPDGVGNRGEIIYEGMKPGNAAHGVPLSGDTTALAEGAIRPEEVETERAPTEEAPPAGLRGFLADETGTAKIPDDWEDQLKGLSESARRAAIAELERKQYLSEDRMVHNLPEHLQEAAKAGTLETVERTYGPGARVREASVPNLGAQMAESGPVYHQTNVKNATQIVARASKGGARHENIYVSPNQELALGQAGRGITIEFDPELVQGHVPDSLQNQNYRGLGNKNPAELIISKTVRGAIKSVFTKTKAQLEALKGQPGLASRLDFDRAEPVGKGFRIPAKVRSLMTEESGQTSLGQFDKLPPTYSSDGAEIMASMGTLPEKPGWFENLKDWANSAYQGILEKNHYVMQMARLAEQGGMLKEDAELPFKLARQVEYANSKARSNIDGDMTSLTGDVLGPGFMKILEPFKDEKGDTTFQTYMLAKQANRAAMEGKAHPVDPVTAARFIFEHKDKYEAAFRQMVEFQNHTLRWLAEDGVGISSREDIDKWIEEHPDYVPAQRDMDTTVGAKTGRGLAAFDPIRTAKGSMLPVKPIFQQIMEQTIQRRMLATEAMAGNAIGNMARDWGLLEPVGKGRFVKLKVGLGEMLAKDVGDDAMAQAIDALKLDDDYNLTIGRLLGTKLESGEFPIFENGEMTKLGLPKGLDKDSQKLAIGLIRTLRAADSAAYPFIRKIMAPLVAPARLLRAAVSLPPSFSYRILQYDIPLQAGTNAGIKNILDVTVNGLYHAFGKTELWDEARKVGLMNDVIEHISNEDYIRNHLDGKDPTWLNGIWNGVGNYSGAIPLYRLLRNFRATMGQVLPTGVYAAAKKAAEKSGEPLDRAVTGYNMSESVFHRPGYGGDLGRLMNAMAFPFLAYAKMLRTATVGLFIKPNKVLYGVGGLMTAVTLANWYTNKDQEWYKARPNWQKDKVLFMHIGPDWTKTGQQDAMGNDMYEPHGVTIPIWEWTPILSTVFSAVPRRLAELVFEKDPTALSGIGESFASTLTPPGFTGATALAPLIENMSNHSFLTGQPLASDETIKDHSTPEQVTPYTSGVAHFLGQAIGHIPLLDHAIAPWQIDNVIKAWTGKPGQVALRLADQTAQKIGIEAKGKLPNMTTTEALTALIGGSAFTQYQPGASTQQMHDYWDLQTRVDQAHGDILQAIKDDDFSRFEALVKANPVAAVIERDSLHNVAMPANPDQYFDKINQVADSIDNDKLTAYEEAEHAAKNEMKVLKFIESLPIRADAAKVDPASPYDSAAITNDDKRQLMIAYGTTAAMLAEGATKAAHNLGLK